MNFNSKAWTSIVPSKMVSRILPFHGLDKSPNCSAWGSKTWLRLMKKWFLTLPYKIIPKMVIPILFNRHLITVKNRKSFTVKCRPCAGVFRGYLLTFYLFTTSVACAPTVISVPLMAKLNACDERFSTSTSPGRTATRTTCPRKPILKE